jgi:radical SAM superfamily enzyme YgiQ (UPF0313 family)
MHMRAAAPAQSETPSIAVKPGSIALSIGTGTVLAFDLEGRLYSAYLGGRTFRRGLSGRVVEKGRFPGAGRGERWSRPCDIEERLALYRKVCSLVEEVRAHHRRDGARLVHGERERATVLLSRVLAWTPERLEADRGRFSAVYGDVGILPPDQYLAVVLQATRGCAWNRCTFCPFYRDQRYRVKTREEFLAHIRAVSDLLGEGVRLRRSIFLGDANAIGAPLPRLLTFLDMAREAFPRQRGVHAFMDLFTAKKAVEEYRQLGARGLKRVIVGLETGCDELLAFVRKPGSAGEAAEAVRDLKTAGINVGVVVLLGLGAVRYFDDHARETIRILNAMGLSAGDIIYFSPLLDLPGAEYGEQAQAEGIGRLDPDEVRAQEAMIRRGLEFSGPPPRLARYDVREFLY